MRYIHVIIIGLIVLLLGGSAQAEEQKSDGNKLLRYCESKTDALGAMWCLGYMNAILDMQPPNETLFLFNRLPLCIPPEVTVGQAQRVVVKYLQEHPKELHWKQIGLTYIALSRAFPCPVPSAPQ